MVHELQRRVDLNMVNFDTLILIAFLILAKRKHFRKISS